MLLTSQFDRRKIALLLASAVLQLHDTHWLRRSWTLEDILVMDNNELCVSCNFDDASQNHPPSTTNTAVILRNETLFALGEALLELVYQVPLSSPDPQTRLCTALEMARKLQNDELENFATAVAKCLCPTSPTILDFDLSQDSFLNWYYQEIVMPLKEDYEVFLKRSYT